MQAENLGVDKEIFEYVAKSVTQSPFYNLIGVRLISLGPGSAEMIVTACSQHTNPADLVQGGVIMTIADAAMANSVRSLGISPVTVDCSTSFLASAELGKDIITRGKVIKRGKNLLFAEADVWSEGILIATAKATFFNIGEIKV